MSEASSLGGEDTPSIIDHLKAERRTGCLEVRSAAHGACRLYLLFGVVYHAVGPSSEGDAALTEALSWRDASLWFDERTQLPHKETVTLGRTEIGSLTDPPQQSPAVVDLIGRPRVTASPFGDSATRLRARGLFSGVLICVGLGLGLVLVGLLAIPPVASGLLLYRSLQEGATAHAYRTAVPCGPSSSSGDNCLSTVDGTIASVDTNQGLRGVVTTELSIELPSGIQSARMTTFGVQSPRWLQAGQPVRVLRYQGKITQIGITGAQVDTDDNPGVHQQGLLIAGLMALGFTLLLDGGIFISILRRPRGGPAPLARGSVRPGQG